MVGEGPAGVGDHEVVAIEPAEPFFGTVGHVELVSEEVLTAEGGAHLGLEDGGEAVGDVGFAPVLGFVTIGEVGVDLVGETVVVEEVEEVDADTFALVAFFDDAACFFDVLLVDAAEACFCHELLDVFGSLGGEESDIDVAVVWDEVVFAVGTEEGAEDEEHAAAKGGDGFVGSDECFETVLLHGFFFFALTDAGVKLNDEWEPEMVIEF